MRKKDSRHTSGRMSKAQTRFSPDSSMLRIFLICCSSGNHPLLSTARSSPPRFWIMCSYRYLSAPAPLTQSLRRHTSAAQFHATLPAGSSGTCVGLVRPARAGLPLEVLHQIAGNELNPVNHRIKSRYQPIFSNNPQQTTTINTSRYHIHLTAGCYHFSSIFASKCAIIAP